MNQNLDLLRQNHCRPAIATGKTTNYLFPLEKECEQGKTLLAQLPKTLLQLQEFNPYGLHRTYRDEASGLLLCPDLRCRASLWEHGSLVLFWPMHQACLCSTDSARGRSWFSPLYLMGSCRK